MSALVALKALDVAVLLLSAWERYAQSVSTREASVDRLNEIRERLKAGDVSEEDALRDLDALISDIQAKRQAAIAALYSQDQIKGDTDNGV